MSRAMLWRGHAATGTIHRLCVTNVGMMATLMAERWSTAIDLLEESIQRLSRQRLVAVVSVVGVMVDSGSGSGGCRGYRRRGRWNAMLLGGGLMMMMVHGAHAPAGEDEPRQGEIPRGGPGGVRAAIEGEWYPISCWMGLGRPRL